MVKFYSVWIEYIHNIVTSTIEGVVVPYPTLDEAIEAVKLTLEKEFDDNLEWEMYRNEDYTNVTAIRKNPANPAAMSIMTFNVVEEEVDHFGVSY